MAHKTLIGGTAYEIDGGKAMVDGTVYEIDHGVANVDGTAYEVGFDDGMRTVSISCSSSYQNQDYAYMEIDGVKYYAPTSWQDPANEITVPVGTKVKFVAKAITTLGSDNKATIKLNGQTVEEATASKGTTPVTVEYSLVITKDIRVSMSVTYVASGTTMMQGVSTITITET